MLIVTKTVVPRSGKSTISVITKVPPEILICIFQWFCSHCCNEYKWPFGPPPGSTEAHNTSALFKLCLVSHSFRNIAQKILFHSFDPSACIPLDGPAPWRKHWERRLEPFLQTVAARPDLARSVKAVFMTKLLTTGLDLDYSRKAFQACVRALGKSPLEMFRKDSNSVKRPCLLSPLSPAEVPTRAEDLCAELISVLVAILPNLTHLAVSSQYACHGSLVVWDVLPDILDKFRVGDIPTIKTIETHEPPRNLLRRCTKIETWITDGWHSFPDMPTVKHLHFRYTHRYMRVDYSKCINACSGSLSTISCVNATDNLYQAIDIPRLHDSLEVLHLGAKYLTPLPSLLRFNKLRYLFLDSHGIYGMIPVSQSPLYSQSVAKILPRNIVGLSVSSCFHTQERWERDLCEVLASKDDIFPALQSIMSSEAIVRKDLEELCDRLGLKWVCRKEKGYSENSSYYCRF